MARSRVVLDHAGIGAVLKSAEVREAVGGLAADVHSNVRSHPAVVRNGVADSVRLESYTTDRAAFAVVIAHAAGLPIQAKHGALTQAAGAAGLEVRERDS